MISYWGVDHGDDITKAFKVPKFLGGAKKAAPAKQKLPPQPDWFDMKPAAQAPPKLGTAGPKNPHPGVGRGHTYRNSSGQKVRLPAESGPAPRGPLQSHELRNTGAYRPRHPERGGFR